MTIKRQFEVSATALDLFQPHVPLCLLCYVPFYFIGCVTACLSLIHLSSVQVCFLLKSFFFFFWLPPPRHMEFPGQGSDLSCDCDLHHSYGNTKALTHCAGPMKNEPASQGSRVTTDPVAPQRETLETFFDSTLFYLRNFRKGYLICVIFYH